MKAAVDLGTFADRGRLTRAKYKAVADGVDAATAALNGPADPAEEVLEDYKRSTDHQIAMLTEKLKALSEVPSDDWLLNYYRRVEPAMSKILSQLDAIEDHFIEFDDGSWALRGDGKWRLDAIAKAVGEINAIVTNAFDEMTPHPDEQLLAEVVQQWETADGAHYLVPTALIDKIRARLSGDL